jgi:type I restriction enzyme, S subunit
MIFKEYSFLDLLSVIIDNRGKTVPVSEEGIPLIATNCIKNETLYPAYDKVRYVSKSTYDTWFRGHPQPGDMIFTCKGSPGRVCWVPDPIDFCIAQDMVGIRANEKIIYPKYLFALLRSEGTQNKILNMHVGTLIPHFKKGDFGNLYFDIPTDMEYQKKVGDAYFDFCLKIEANRQTNQTLEHIAQAIFKSWFVDFEPTRAKIAAKQIAQARQDSERSATLKAALFADGRWPEAVAAAIAEGDPERAAMAAISGKSLDELDAQGCANAAGAGSAGAAYQLSPEQQTQLLTTAALFPDALVDSELGEIPEGWDVKGIKELSSKISKGTTPRKADIQKAEDAETIPFLKVRDISNDGEITRVGLDKIPESIHSGTLKRSMLEANDLLFSIAGTIGRVALVEEDLSISNCNQAIAFVRLKESEKYLELCRLNLVGSRVQDEVISKVVQGVQANFSLTGLGEIKVLIPSEDLLASFNKTVGDMGNKQRLLLSENRKLAELRDALLPKLLSGELELTSKGAA